MRGKWKISCRDHKKFQLQQKYVYRKILVFVLSNLQKLKSKRLVKDFKIINVQLKDVRTMEHQLQNEDVITKTEAKEDDCPTDNSNYQILTCVSVTREQFLLRFCTSFTFNDSSIPRTKPTQNKYKVYNKQKVNLLMQEICKKRLHIVTICQFSVSFLTRE